MYSKKVVFWSACLGMLLFGITLIVLGSIAPGLKEKLHLSEIEAGTLFSILPLGILVGSLIFGPVADRYGYKLLMIVSCLLLTAGFEGIAFTQSHGLLKAFIFLTGVSGGAINGATNALVSDISGHDKIANISLLGVFFGIGALGMPVILGILGGKEGFELIVAAVGILSLAIAVLFASIRLPLPKVTGKIEIVKVMGLFRDKVLILIAFFLFFQSSFEAIMNNWTTAYLLDYMGTSRELSLYGLSLFVTGMVIMRLITGTILRNIPAKRILIASFIFVFTGLISIKSGISAVVALTGFMLTGAGLAGGFPVMLGLVGDRYASISGTAFSFVLTVALMGNMIINYMMGIISDKAGIGNLISVAFAEMIVLTLIGTLIVLQLKKR